MGKFAYIVLSSGRWKARGATLQALDIHTACRKCALLVLVLMCSCNAGHTQDNYQVLTCFKKVGNHSTVSIDSFNSVILCGTQ